MSTRLSQLPEAPGPAEPAKTTKTGLDASETAWLLASGSSAWGRQPTEPTEMVRAISGSVGFAGFAGTPERERDASNPAADLDAMLAHVAMDDGEIEQFVARMRLMVNRGFSEAEAERLAEKLLARDRDGDDRRLCIECSYLGPSGRCLAAALGRLPGVSARSTPVVTVLQRCPAFGLKKGLA